MESDGSFEESDEELIVEAKHSTGNKKSGFNDFAFVKLLELFPCLMDKGQSQPMKIKKRDAICELQEKIQSEYGFKMKTNQIKKKFENMKLRIKQKFEKMKSGNKRNIVMKVHEKMLLNLMKYEKHPVSTKVDCKYSNFAYMKHEIKTIL